MTYSPDQLAQLLTAAQRGEQARTSGSDSEKKPNQITHQQKPESFGLFFRYLAPFPDNQYSHH